MISLIMIAITQTAQLGSENGEYRYDELFSRQHEVSVYDASKMCASIVTCDHL